MSDLEYAIKVRNLNKSYVRNVPILSDVSFDIPAGKIVGLLGPNGCGKTTLLKILSGCIHDYTGQVLVGGNPPGPVSKANTAFLPDTTYLADYFRTVDAIDYFNDFFYDFDRVKAMEFVERFGLNPKQKIKTMSKGMQEKVQLLLVMSRKAQLYLLDEPLGGVDPAARENILDIIMTNYAEKSTLLLSTHMVNDLEESFNHVLILGQGKVLVNTSVDNVRKSGRTLEEVFKEVIRNDW
ncbi:MAG: ABC transporter ATP-binding protein [Clostridiales bacterium]|nr:ABC transporter ATP-binding protein [Clostridiales bacterium]